MAKIILKFKGDTVADYPLERERTTIGRKPHNDICIDNLAVSGEHAAIVSIYNYHFLEDLGSTNGTFINGGKIQKHILNNGDTVQIGKHELQYIDEERSLKQGGDKTVTVRGPLTDLGGTAGDGVARARPAGEPAAAYLEILNGPNKGKYVGLANASTTIGRQGSQLAVILRLSKNYHISRGPGKFSALLNGKPVDARQLLHNHDIVELDNIRMEFINE